MATDKNNFPIEKSIIAKVTPSQVLNALANPELTKKYIYSYEIKSG